jgi:FlaA1/EpsC-like NDP-sugar epimerase
MDEMEMQRKKPSQNIKSVLVTGAGGFLGGKLIKQLSLTTNYQIFVLTSNKEKVLARFSDVKQLSCFDIEEWKSGKLPSRAKR